MGRYLYLYAGVTLIRSARDGHSSVRSWCSLILAPVKSPWSGPSIWSATFNQRSGKVPPRLDLAERGFKFRKCSKRELWGLLWNNSATQRFASYSTFSVCFMFPRCQMIGDTGCSMSAAGRLVKFAKLTSASCRKHSSLAFLPRAPLSGRSLKMADWQ